jgi:hypothetical protein
MKVNGFLIFIFVNKNLDLNQVPFYYLSMNPMPKLSHF